MGVDYYVCGECGEGFPDTRGEWCICEECGKVWCDECLEEAIANGTLLEIENEEGYYKCAVCPEETVTITKKEYEELLKLKMTK